MVSLLLAIAPLSGVPVLSGHLHESDPNGEATSLCGQGLISF